MSDYPKKLRAYPDEPTVVITRSFIEEIAAHIERVEGELAAVTKERDEIRMFNAMIYGTSHPEIYKTLEDERIEQLEAELAAERERADKLDRAWIASNLELTKALERVAKLREALEPFDKEASVWEGYADEEILVEQFPDLPGIAALTVGDLRRARAALEQARKG